MVSAGFLILIPYLPRWFTKDDTLQDMVGGLLPFIAIGNVLMVWGMVSWSLVGAQGRFKIATFVSAVMSFCVTLPLSTGFCVGFRFSLEALVGAVLIGYSTTGLAMGYILQMSDWEGISKSIIALHDEDDQNNYSSSSDSSLSSADEFVDNSSPTSIVKTSASRQTDSSTKAMYNSDGANASQPIFKSLATSKEQRGVLQEILDKSKAELTDFTSKASKDVNEGDKQDMTKMMNLLIEKMSRLENELEEQNKEIAGLKEDTKEMVELYSAELSEVSVRQGSNSSYTSSSIDTSTGLFSIFNRSVEKDRQVLYPTSVVKTSASRHTNSSTKTTRNSEVENGFHPILKSLETSEEQRPVLRKCMKKSKAELTGITIKTSKDVDEEKNQDMTKMIHLLIAKVSGLKNELDEKNEEIEGLKKDMEVESKLYSAELSDLIERQNIDSSLSSSSTDISLGTER